MISEWRTVEFKLRLIGDDGSIGEMPVSGDALGELAITPAWLHGACSAPRFSITHIRSTYCFSRVTYTIEDARQIVQDLHHLDWDFDDPADLSAATRQAVQQYAVQRRLLLAEAKTRRTQ